MATTIGQILVNETLPEYKALVRGEIGPNDPIEIRR